MIATRVPGSTASAAGTVTWASTLPTATAMPSGSPVHSAARAHSRPAGSPSCTQRVLQLVDDEAVERRVQLAEELGGRVGAVLVDALVARGAGVADVGAGELPDDPVGRLDPVPHRGVDRRGLLQQLQALGELPLRGDQAPVAGQPGLGTLPGQLVDPVGLALRGVVAPQLDVRVRVASELGQLAERGALGGGGHHRAGGEVGADPDDLRRVDPGGRDRGRHGRAQHLDVVGRNLQRPLRRQRPAVRERPVQHGVGVVGDRAAELGTVGDPHDDRPARQRPEVDPDDQRIGGGRGLGRWERHEGTPSSGVAGAAPAAPGDSVSDNKTGRQDPRAPRRSPVEARTGVLQVQGSQLGAVSGPARRTAAGGGIPGCSCDS